MQLSMPFCTSQSIAKGEESTLQQSTISHNVSSEASRWSADRARSQNSRFQTDGNAPEVYFTGEMVSCSH